jgi:O-methyltransferase
MWGTAPDVTEPSDMLWYASDAIGDYEVVGQWDLRGGIREYIGKYDVDGKTVLEIGPASGYMTFAMEEMGASVTAIDTDIESPNASWDYTPSPKIDTHAPPIERLTDLRNLRNAFWYAHQKKKSGARVWYGDVQSLPVDFGTYDVGTLTAVLLHCRDITGIMQTVARHVTEAIIITERHFDNLPPLPICLLDPAIGRSPHDTWWRFTPEFFCTFLGSLGFGKQTVSFHKQTSVRRTADVPLFTVVASRQ